jgi:hypothetical protein
MFAISQVLLNTTGAFKNINQISTYSIITGLVLYASIYLYLLFYNEEYVSIFNKFVIYIIMIDLLLSMFYYFNIKKSQNKMLAEDTLAKNEEDTEGMVEDDMEDDMEDDIEGDDEMEGEDDIEGEDDTEYTGDVEDSDGEGYIESDMGGEDVTEDAAVLEELEELEDVSHLKEMINLNGGTSEIFCPENIHFNSIDEALEETVELEKVREIMQEIEEPQLLNANELSFLEEPIKQKPKRVYKKKAANLN